MRSADNLEYVGFWARAGAGFLDSILTMAVTLPLTFLMYAMASTTRRLVQLGHDVINGSRGEDSQAIATARAAAPGARAVQLD